MTEEQQRIAIAEACGWTLLETDFKEWTLTSPTKSRKVFDNQFQALLSLPNYLNDLNAMHEAEKMLTDKEYEAFCMELFFIVKSGRLISATSGQRAEAFLKAKGLWI